MLGDQQVYSNIDSRGITDPNPNQGVGGTILEGFLGSILEPYLIAGIGLLILALVLVRARD